MANYYQKEDKTEFMVTNCGNQVEKEGFRFRIYETLLDSKELCNDLKEDYEEELMAKIPTCTSGRWHPAFTDITAKGADKGEGIRTMAEHLGLDFQNTIAFGDGGNDSSMIKAAGIGVAMGNALESLKAEADYTTTSVDNDGIMNALRHLGLI